MAIIGFILILLLLGYLTFAFVMLCILDGAFGDEEIKWYLKIVFLGVLAYGWYKLVEFAPFTVALN
jgi:hypothetical protein